MAVCIIGTIPLVQPVISAATLSSSSQRVSLDTPATAGGAPYASYTLRRATNAGMTTNLVTEATGLEAIFPRTVTGLNPSTTYYYQVTAADAAGNTLASGVVSATTSAAPGVGLIYSTDFTEFALGSDIHGQGGNGFEWTGGNGDGRPRVVDCPFDPGRRALRFKYADFSLDPHYWEEQRFNIGRPLTEVWIEFYVWYPDGTEPDGEGGTLHRWDHIGDGGNSTNRKLLALWPDETYSGATPRSVIHMWLNYGDGTSYSNVGRTIGDDPLNVVYYSPSGKPGSIHITPVTMVGPGDRGRWIQVRFYQKVARWQQNEGIHRLWKDGVMGLNITNDPYYDRNGVDGSHNVQRGYIGGDDSSSGRHQALTYQYFSRFSVWGSSPGWE